MEVKLLGRKAEVKYISWGRPDVYTRMLSLGMKDPPIEAVDHITVFFSLKEAVTAGFGIIIPIKDYSEEEFLKLITEKGEEQLQKHLNEAELNRKEVEED